jgi:hypothetical protein
MGLVVFNLNVLVLFGMQPELLFALLIFKTNRVGLAVGPVLTGAREPSALGGVGGRFSPL